MQWRVENNQQQILRQIYPTITAKNGKHIIMDDAPDNSIKNNIFNEP